MSGLFGGRGRTISTEDPRIGALRIQQSAYGLVIPIVWGRTRIAGNLIWYGDFASIGHTETQSSGGKGGGGATSSHTSYTYQTAAAFGLCEGQINDIGTVWSGKQKTSLGALGLTLFLGATPQTPWGYLSTYHPSEALAYQATAYVAGVLQLGDSAALPNLSFEVLGLRSYQLDQIFDVNPSDIISDFLTHSSFGAGFPPTKLASLTQFSDYCAANGIFLSPALTEQRPAHQHLEDMLQAAHAAAVWSEGKLKILPFGDTAISGNGATYVPDITPRYDLTDDDFLASGGDDPVIVTRKTVADAFNQVQIEYLDRLNDYNPSVLELKDQANVEAFGLRPMPPLKMYAITERSVAEKIAPLILQRALYIRNEYEFRLGWRFCLLEPMDIVTLTDAGLGLDLFQVRIMEVEEDEEGELRILAEDFPFGIAHPPQIVTQAAGGYAVNYNVAPGAANRPVIFEPPIALSGQPEIWLAASGGAAWGGAEVWVSIDDTTYKRVGEINGRARHGVLGAALPIGDALDMTNAIRVDLTISNGQLVGGTADDRDLFNTLCYADGELIGYRDAELRSANVYDLSSLRRGAYGTSITAHDTGMPFVRCDAGIFRYAYDSSLIGRPLYIKLRSFNLHHAAHEDLSAIEPVVYDITGQIGAPSAVSSFLIDGDRLSWTAVSDADVVGYMVRYHYGVNYSWGTAAALHEGLITAAPYILPVSLAGQVTFLIKAIDRYGNESVQAAAVVTQFGDPIVENVVITHDLAAEGFPGTVTGGSYSAGQLVADSTAFMWTGSATSMWKSAGEPMWAGAYANMQYQSQIVVAPTEAGARMTLASVIAGNAIAISYRPQGPAAMWSQQSADTMWVDDVVAQWHVPDYLPWPGAVTAESDIYDFLVETGAGVIQGIVTEFAIQIDVPDIVEHVSDFAIASGGTRLALQAAFRIIKNVQLTLQTGAGSAVTIKAMDKDLSGPLIQCFDSSGAGTSGTVDATIQGY